MSKPPTKRKPRPSTQTRKDTLTEMELAFVGHFTGNQSEAARLAGFKNPKEAGYSLMQRPRVQKAIATKMDAAYNKAGDALGKVMAATITNVLRELCRLGFVDPRKFFNEDGSPIPITELDDDTAMALAGFEMIEQFEGSGADRKFTGYLKKFKIVDKRAALVDIGKHLGMFIERRLELPGDFDSKSLEEQEFFCKHGYWPNVDGSQPSPQGS